METVFLKDGTKATLISKTEKGYVVNPVKIYHDYETKEEYEEASGDVKLVEDIYDSAPIEVIQEEYKEILEKVLAKEKELSDKDTELCQLQGQLERVKRTITDTSRYIINREQLMNAKRLIVWSKNHIAPRIMEGGTRTHRFTLSYEITQYAGEERLWAYTLWNENRENGWSNSEYFDEKYGIKVDLTDEEILKLTHERIPQLKKEYYSFENVLINTPDEWLSPEYLNQKNVAVENQKNKTFADAKEKLKKAQEEYESLTSLLSPVQ